ncbi:MAG: hypothetical protein OFPII_03640 [Osedax symbiont Rs1]|nr:MAG: hypothetical protein OFPII_03640 [Osedax symbiont Rs1]
MTNKKQDHAWHDEDIIDVSYKNADDPAYETVYIDMGDEGSTILNRADVIMLAEKFGIKVVEGFSPQILSEQLDKAYYIAKDAGLDTAGISSAENIIGEIQKMLSKGGL